MKAETRNAHIFDLLGSIQGRELHSEPSGVMRLNSGRASGLEKLLQPFVPEGLDHVASYNVAHRATTGTGLDHYLNFTYIFAAQTFVDDGQILADGALDVFEGFRLWRPLGPTTG